MFTTRQAQKPCALPTPRPESCTGPQPFSFFLVAFPSFSSSLVYDILAKMPKAIPPLETCLHQGVCINEPSWYILHHLKDFHWIRYCFDIGFANFKDG
jgi:hypothetical protein